MLNIFEKVQNTHSCTYLRNMKLLTVLRSECTLHANRWQWVHYTLTWYLNRHRWHLPLEDVSSRVSFCCMGIFTPQAPRAWRTELCSRGCWARRNISGSMREIDTSVRNRRRRNFLAEFQFGLFFIHTKWEFNAPISRTLKNNFVGHRLLCREQLYVCKYWSAVSTAAFVALYCRIISGFLSSRLEMSASWCIELRRMTAFPFLGHTSTM